MNDILKKMFATTNYLTNPTFLVNKRKSYPEANHLPRR